MSYSRTVSGLNVSARLPSAWPEEVGDAPPSFAEIANATGQYIVMVEDERECEARIQFANDAFLLAFGWTQPEICQHSLKDLISPYHYNILRERYNRGSHQQRQLLTSMVVGLKNRKGKSIEVELFPSFVRSSKAFSTILFCTSIERRLQHANRYFELYDNAIDAIFTLDKSGRIQDGNQKVEELTGHRAGKLDELQFKKFMPKESAKGMVTFLKRRLEGKCARPSYQFEFLSKDGENKFLDVTTVRNPLSDSEIVVNIRDVTDIKRLEKEIRESEEKYRSLVEQSRDIIFLLQGGRTVFVNHVAHEILGDRLPTSNIPWKALAKLLPEEDQLKVIEFFERALEGKGNNSSTEIRLEDKNGTNLHMVLTTEIINYKGRKALIGTMRDITESKKLEQKTKESEKLGTLAQFTASVAHEIRNPLEGLTSAVLLLSRGLDVRGENRDLMDVILNATNEINTTINQVVSMINEPRYSFSTVDVRALLANTVGIVTKCKQYDSRVTITTSNQRGVARIFADERELKKACANVVSNACQAIRGEGKVRIRVARAQQGCKKFVSITIRDTGTGVPASILPQVWEPFTTTKKKGMGMGLFITKRIVEDHGGTIQIVSTNKSGTTVQIDLPAQRAEE
jgi:PAS domain S-box-containing protein